MQNNLKMGFEYDITHEDGNGVVLSHQKAKNILINEGIKNFYYLLFNIKSLGTNTMPANPNFIYLFIESEYEPQPTDSLNENNALDLYECDYNNTLLNQGDYVKYYTLCTYGATVGKDGKSVVLNEGYYKFTGYKRLTGVCIFRSYLMLNGSGTFRVTRMNDFLNKSFLLSAAKFSTPIQVMPGGIVRVRGNFFLNPQ